MLRANIVRITCGLLISFTGGAAYFYYNDTDYHDYIATASTIFLMWFLYVISELLLYRYNVRMRKELRHKMNRDSVCNLKIPKDVPAEYRGDIQYMWNRLLQSWGQKKTNVRMRDNTMRMFVYYLGFMILTAALVAGSVYVTTLSAINFKPSLVTGSALTVLLLIATILELLVFIQVSAAVKWDAKRDTLRTQLEDRVCLLIACHKSCYTPDRAEHFEQTIRHALAIFPPEAIFVCDNSNDPAPSDHTEQVCNRINPAINYVYIPEGNKTHAIYWVTEYWIPHLQRWSIIGDYDYSIMIDDDVWLPKDMDLCTAMMSDQNIAGLGYAITAVDAKGRKNMLVELQDIEYKLAGYFKHYQSSVHTISWAHGAISLWRRDVLGEKVLYDHDTVFHGEDMYMGVLLQQFAPNKSIKYITETPVPTFVPHDLLTLFRQRVRSWDLCNQRKFFTFGKLLMTNNNYYLKPFYFLEIVNICIDWLKPFMMGIGLVYYTVSAVFSLVLYVILTYTLLLLFVFRGLHDRSDIRPTVRAILMFPFYRIFSGSLRFIALMHNAVWYTPLHPTNDPIRIREQVYKNIPPVPPYPKPNWKTVYTAVNKDSAPSKTLQELQKLFNTNDNVNFELLVLAYIEFSRIHLFINNESVKYRMKGVLLRKKFMLLYSKFRLIEDMLFEHVLKETSTNYTSLRAQLENLILLEPYEHDPTDDHKRWARIFIRSFNNVCFYIWQIHNPLSHDNTLQIKQILAVQDLFIDPLHNYLTPNDSPANRRKMAKKYAHTLRRVVENDTDSATTVSDTASTILVKPSGVQNLQTESVDTSDSENLEYELSCLEDMRADIEDEECEFSDGDVESVIKSVVYGEFIGKE